MGILDILKIDSGSKKTTRGFYFGHSEAEGENKSGIQNFEQYFEDYLTNNYRIKSHMCDFSSDIENFSTPLIADFQTFQKNSPDPPERMHRIIKVVYFRHTNVV